MNLAAIHSLAYKTRSQSVPSQSIYRKLTLLFMTFAIVLLVSYLFLAVTQIGVRHTIAAAKADIKKLQEYNSESEVLLATLHANEPTEAHFAELGLVKSKNVSYIEIPAQSFVRASR